MISRLWVACACLAAAGATKPLAIQQIALSQYEDGPTVGSQYTFLPGEPIFFSFHIAGYKAIGDEDQRMSLTYAVEAADPAGLPIIEMQEGKVDTELDEKDKDWSPKVRVTIAIPPFAPSGEYTIKMGISDRVGISQVQGKATFRVKGVDIEPSDKLVIRAFNFYRTEDGKNPLTPAVYHPGDSLWARFDITGYKFGGKNAFEVGYGLEVLRPTGESMFRQPDAAVEKQESFYPRRFLPAGLSLNLDKTMKPGQYTLVVLASDKLGSQTVESRQQFTVE